MNNTVTLRPAAVNDAADIHMLNKHGLGYDYPQDKTRERLGFILSSEADRVWVAQYDGHIVGYIHASDYICTYSDPAKNIMSIVVGEEYRGMGIGRALLEAAENWAKESHCVGIRLVSGAYRKEAHQFYLHCGYETHKDQKNFSKMLFR